MTPPMPKRGVTKREQEAAFQCETAMIDEFRRLNAEYAVAPNAPLAARIEALLGALAARGLVFGPPPRHEAGGAAVLLVLAGRRS